MKRSSMIESDPYEIKKVALVERNPEPYGFPLANTFDTSTPKPSDQLVQLALEIQKADTFVHANACNKLEMIAQQVRFLKKQAENVLRETKLSQDLHRTACNFVKVPGNIYHLYKRLSDQNYFSMLSPQEWISCPHQYLGSFRLENDYSWTSLECIQEKDENLMLFDKILTKGNNINLQLMPSDTHMDL